MPSLRKGNLRLALNSIRATKARSLLTTLGIIIGVMSVVVTVGLGEGVKQQIVGQNVRYGKGIIVVKPMASRPSVLSGDGLPGGANSMLSSADYDAVRSVPGVKTAVPLSAISGNIVGDKMVKNPLVVATNTSFEEVVKQKIEYGGFFEEGSATPTAVIGPKLAQRLFNDNAPLGQTFTFRGHTFMIAGVFEEFAAAPFSLEANFNEAVFVSYKSVEAVLGGAPSIYEILVKTDGKVPSDTVQRQILSKLSSAHGGAEDVVASTSGSGRNSSDQTLRLLTLMTIGAAIVAFIVGGVGIMNIMLVSVTERIHEIGLRKAIGATNRQIMNQFVAEAFVLSAIGAVIGVILSVIAIFVLRLYTTLQPVIVWPVLIIVPLVAVATGVLFGSIPAMKAAQKDPIEALRHE